MAMVRRATGGRFSGVRSRTLALCIPGGSIQQYSKPGCFLPILVRILSMRPNDYRGRITTPQ